MNMRLFVLLLKKLEMLIFVKLYKMIPVKNYSSNFQLARFMGPRGYESGYASILNYVKKVLLDSQ